MKKCVFIFLLFNLLFISNVYADELQINIRDLTQNNISLVKEDGMYIANSLDYVYISIGLENAGNNNYYLYMKNNYDNPTVFQMYGDGGSYSLPTFNDEVEEYIIKICGDEECSIEYASTSFYLKNTLYKEMQSSKMYITSIKQGGNEIVPDENNIFTFNNKQDIVFSIKGENLISNLEYIISDGVYEDRVSYLGSELEEGITYIYNPNNNENFYLEYVLGMFYSNFLYKDTGTGFYDYFKEFVSDETLGDYNATLMYSNYRDKEIEMYHVDENDFYMVSGQYYNSNNKLLYKIDGSGYQDIDYAIDLEIKEGKTVVYTKKICVNGLLLNNGYEIILDDLVLKSNKIYSLYFDINGISNRKSIRYVDKSIGIESIKQGNQELELSDGVYVVTDFGELTAKINLDSLVNVDNTFVRLTGPNGATGYNRDRINFSPKYQNEFEEYTILICDEWECNEIYAIEKFKIKFSKYQELKNSKVIISNVMQGGKKIESDENGNFNINDKQNVTYTITGENLFENEIYTFYNGYKRISYLGSELEEGITFTHYINNSHYVNTGYSINEIYFNDFYYFDGSEYHHNGEDYYYVSFNTSINNDLKDFNMELTYSNNEIVDMFGIINADIYDTNKKLNIKIDGDGFADKDYNLSIKVMCRNNLAYENSINVNGLLLNNDYQYVINNLNLEIASISDEYDDEYNIYVSIDDVTKITYFVYKYGGGVGGNPYYKNKKMAINGVAIGAFGSKMLYSVNPNIINNDKINIRYLGYELIDDRLYDYEIIYTVRDDYYSTVMTNVVKSGKISGADFMDNQLNYDVYLDYSLDSDYTEEYSFVLKYNGNVVSKPVIQFVKEDRPMITEFKVKSNNAELNKTDDYYLVDNNSLTFEFKGIGFDDNKNYTLDINIGTSKEKFDGYVDLDFVNKKVSISGSKLNNGYSYKVDRGNNDRYSSIRYTISEDDGFIYDEDNIYVEYSDYDDYMKGDMNKNNKIDLKDIILLIKKYLGTEDMSSQDIIVGDMNNNNKIDLKDIIILIKKYLGIE